LHAQTALYTNHDVVDALLARLRWPHGNKRLIDPSWGTGCSSNARCVFFSPHPRRKHTRPHATSQL
jgi:hypothetical protein